MLSCDLPLSTIHISHYCQFSGIRISQGSVLTYVRYGGIFKYDSVANLPLSLQVKQFRELVNICGSYGQELSCFFDSQCTMSSLLLTIRVCILGLPFPGFPGITDIFHSRIHGNEDDTIPGNWNSPGCK